MFDIDTGKLLIVAVLALIVIGPKDLPRVLRQVGQSVGKLRRMASEFQGQFMDAIKDAEIDDIRKELKDLEAKADLDYHFNPARDIQSELTSAMAPAVSTTSDASVESPIQNFTLPALPDEAGATVAAEGIAPVAEVLSGTSHEAGDANGFLPTPGGRPKRKIFIKPHQSRFARVNSDRTVEMTGQPLSVRQRLVRSRKPLSHDVMSS